MAKKAAEANIKPQEPRRITSRCSSEVSAKYAIVMAPPMGNMKPKSVPMPADSTPADSGDNRRNIPTQSFAAVSAADSL